MKGFDRDTMQNSRWDMETEFNFNNLVSFLNQATSLYNQNSVLKTSVIERATDPNSFEKECSDLDDLCIVALMDSVKEGRLKQEIDILSKLKRKYYEKKIQMGLY